MNGWVGGLIEAMNAEKTLLGPCSTRASWERRDFLLEGATETRAVVRE